MSEQRGPEIPNEIEGIQEALDTQQEETREATDLRTKYEALKLERDGLKAQVERLSAPVTDAMREDVCKILADAEIQGGSFFLTATRIINFIAARTAPAKETE